MRRLLALAAVAACQATLHAPSHSSPDADGSETSSSTIEIVTFMASAPTLTGGTPDANENETGTLTFLATVTGDVAGGALYDDSGLHYVAFAPGSGSTYTATLTWDGANQVAPIDFAAGTSANRGFVAKFTDTSGNTTTAHTTIAFACRDAYGLDGACGGACTNTKLDVRHCGACTTACTSGQVCGASTCRAAQLSNGTSECLLPLQGVGENCTAICAAAGRTCSKMTGFADTTCAPLYLDYDCSYTIVDRPNVSFVCRC